MAKSALVPLGLRRPEDLEQRRTALVIWNEEMKNVMKIVKYYEEYGLLIKGASKIIEHEAKEHKRGFLGMLLGIPGTS